MSSSTQSDTVVALRNDRRRRHSYLKHLDTMRVSIVCTVTCILLGAAPSVFATEVRRRYDRDCLLYMHSVTAQLVEMCIFLLFPNWSQVSQLRGSPSAVDVDFKSYTEEEKSSMTKQQPEKTYNDDETNVLEVFSPAFDDAEGQQEKYRRLGKCGTTAQAARARVNTRDSRKDDEYCMCMDQRCCGDINSCQSNSRHCAEYGFNCVEPVGDINVSNVCNSRRYTFICFDDDVLFDVA